MAGVERAGKLRRLNAFRRSVPHVSASALSAVLDEVSRSGVPELHSRWDLGRATQQDLLQDTPYGQVLDAIQVKSKAGEDILFPIVNPHAHIHTAFSSGGGFQKLLKERLIAAPPTPETPWRLILYSDEVVPGNVLSHDNRRKVWVVYYS